MKALNFYKITNPYCIGNMGAICRHVFLCSHGSDALPLLLIQLNLSKDKMQFQVEQPNTFLRRTETFVTLSKVQMTWASFVHALSDRGRMLASILGWLRYIGRLLFRVQLFEQLPNFYQQQYLALQGRKYRHP